MSGDLYAMARRERETPLSLHSRLATSQACTIWSCQPQATSTAAKQFDREKVVTAELDDGVPIREVGRVDQEAHGHGGGGDDTGTQRCEAAGGRLREEKRKRRAREGKGHGVTWLTGQPESCRAGWNGSR